jgi:hypothetical protein
LVGELKEVGLLVAEVVLVGTEQVALNSYLKVIQ